MDAVTTIVGIFVWLLGLCVGSFLNVVIYRLPRDLSVFSPSRSFCPGCRRTLPWYENIPLLSWLVLRGRCRGCRTAISVQYPIVEALTGLAFALCYHLLFVEPARVGLDAPELARDWPLLIAWCVLAAAMIACAAMDLFAYMVDTRVTDVAVVAGIVLLAIWPREEFLAGPTLGAAGAAATVALLVSVVMLWRTVWTSPLPPDTPSASTSVADAPGTSADAPRSSRVVGSTAAALLVTAGLAIWLVAIVPATPPTQVGDRVESGALSALNAAPSSLGDEVGSLRLPNLNLPAVFAIVVLFVAMVAAAAPHREADQELHDIIEEEAPQARRLALAELAWLAPIAIAAVIAWMLVAFVPTVADAWGSAIGWSPAFDITPVAGFAFAAHGAIVGALAGWLVRIVFTLVFGREAFGVGDIYILGAAGALAGWDIALLGFVFSIGISLLSWVSMLAMKRNFMIAFAPPLALGFLVALLWNRWAAEVGRYYATLLGELWRQRPDMIGVLGGVLLVGFALAVIIARLLRKLLDRHAPQGE